MPVHPALDGAAHSPPLPLFALFPSSLAQSSLAVVQSRAMLWRSLFAACLVRHDDQPR